MRWQGLRWGLSGVVVLSLAWGIATWRREVNLRLANQEIESGQYRLARERLAWFSEYWQGNGEVHFKLGMCEYNLRHLDAALAAWARVPAGSPRAGWAALNRARIMVQLGRFADAEDLFGEALRSAGAHLSETHSALAFFLESQGRLDEVRRHHQLAWSDSPQQVNTLRILWKLDAPLSFAVEGMLTFLNTAVRQAPDDDRVWLGLANLATLSGRTAEAKNRLEKCLERRPNDPVVWRARLDWALATDQLTEAARAVEHVPADSFTPEQLFALQAWFAARRNDAAAEQLALTALLGRNPADTLALERVAELEYRAGHTERASQLRRRKSDVARVRDRYRTLINSADPRPFFSELSQLAEALGRRFDARCWAKLSLQRAPTNRAALALLAKLDRSEPPSNETGRLRAELLASLKLNTAPLASSFAVIPPDFTDDADVVGLRFVYNNGRSEQSALPETMGGGVALLDYDGDGWLDVYVVQGGPFPPTEPPSHVGDCLFRNRGDGTFEDATAAAGIAELAQGYGHGVAVGDYDNDGHPDLFVTRWRSYALYHNRGDGRFEDVTEAAGLGGDRDWPTSAAFADLDNDGDLDLYVCHYLVWDVEHPRFCQYPNSKAFYYCSPRDFEPLPDHVFRNDGGRFVDVTTSAGMLEHEGRGLGVVAADLDDDGQIDLYVANDMSANYLFHNLSGFRFEETAISAGAACSANGMYESGMGVACGDADGDGRLDLTVTNLYGESTTLYHNLGNNTFVDLSLATGVAHATRHLVGFGLDFIDFNNDGRLDLVSANGHVNDSRPTYPYAMPAQLLAGGEAGRFVDVSDRAGGPWKVLRVGRGLASGDLDNDGRVDVLIVSQNSPLAYFHNHTAGGHFLTLKLEGSASNRDGVGARVTVESGGFHQVAQRVGGGSYLSASDPRLHFGLGARTRVESVEVRWPSGQVDRYNELTADTGYLLREGHARAEPMAGWKKSANSNE